MSVVEHHNLVRQIENRTFSNFVSAFSEHPQTEEQIGDRAAIETMRLQHRDHDINIDNILEQLLLERQQQRPS
jgi:hypothetical protein